jgi:ribA/ribD-fused uncharacterized protein
MEDAVLFYAGEFGYTFSNFSAFGVTWRGRWAMTSEHHYHASKFNDEEIINEIYAANSAHDALKISRKYEAEGRIRSDWSRKLAVEIMYDIITCKHDQNPYVQKQLKESVGRALIENAPKDSFWGRGPDWQGLNMLGKLWMKLRDERYPS